MIQVRKFLRIGFASTLFCSAIALSSAHADGGGQFSRELTASAETVNYGGASWDKMLVERLVTEEATSDSVVPPALALAVARVESNFAPFVRSYAGAIGVMQIMPNTAWHEFRVTEDQLWDPETNVRVGIAFLRQLYHLYGERWDLALSHYNGGSLKKRGGVYVAHSYTRKYVQDVMHWERHYNELALAEACGDSEGHGEADCSTPWRDPVPAAYANDEDPNEAEAVEAPTSLTEAYQRRNQGAVNEATQYPQETVVKLVCTCNHDLKLDAMAVQGTEIRERANGRFVTNSRFTKRSKLRPIGTSRRFK